MEQLFPGQYHDVETGLNYNYFRTYNPATGRYTQSDPIGLRGGVNRYNYVGGRPTIFLDLFGLDKLGIHSNVHGDAGFTAGHSWITHTDNDGNVTTYGLWPDEHPNTVDNGDGTDVRVGMEDGAAALYSRYYDLSPEELARLVEFLSRKDEWGYTHTCADWASDAVRYSVGENVDADDWFGIETPRELSESIELLENERKTSPQNPLPPRDPQSSRGSM